MQHGYKYTDLQTEAELTDVSVVQRLVQGQDAAVCWHGGDLAFFCLPRVVAGGWDGDLVSNLRSQQTHKQTCEQMTHYLPFQKCERGIKNKHLCILIRRQLKVRRSRTDLPVDGLFQGQTVRSSCGSGSEFCVINAVRLSVKLQSTKHTCGTTTQTHTHLVSPKTCNTTQYIHGRFSSKIHCCYCSTYVMF